MREILEDELNMVAGGCPGDCFPPQFPDWDDYFKIPDYLRY